MDGSTDGDIVGNRLVLLDGFLVLGGKEGYIVIGHDDVDDIEGNDEGSMDEFHEGAEEGLDEVVGLGKGIGLSDRSNVDRVDGSLLDVVDGRQFGEEVGKTDDTMLGEVERLKVGDRDGSKVGDTE